MEDPTSLMKTNAIVLVSTLAYIVLPIDVFPDFIPLLGQIDDTVGALFAMAFTAQTAAKLFDQHKSQQPLVSDALDPVVIDQQFDRTSEALDAYEPLTEEQIQAL